MLHILTNTLLNTHKKSRAAPSGELDNVRTVSDNEFIERSRSALAALEIIRLEKLAAYELRKKIGIPAGAIAAPVCMYLDYWLLLLQSTSSGDKVAGLTFLVMGAIYAWVTAPKRQYAKAYKYEILPGIAKLFGDFVYDMAGKIDMTLMQPSQIVPSHHKYHSEDYFRGEYKGVDIEFSEIKLTETHGSGKNRRTVIKFKGLAVLLGTKHKRFYGHTIIDQNRTAVGQWFKQKTGALERADMVDPEFEKIFDAYTNDQVEARYLIDPLMIERLKGVYAEYEGEKMAAAFYENKMLILIASRHNHFEPADIYIPATDPASILSMKKEIGEILSIIDRLSLYDPKAVHEQKQTA